MLPDRLEKELRVRVAEKYGGRKGALGDAIGRSEPPHFDNTSARYSENVGPRWLFHPRNLVDRSVANDSDLILGFQIGQSEGLSQWQRTIPVRPLQKERILVGDPVDEAAQIALDQGPQHLP